MSDVSGLTFDWDDVGLEDGIVQAELEWLCEEFGEEYVWYRVSSSKTGLHIMIGELRINPQNMEFEVVPIPMETQLQLKYREETQIECRGRFFSDMVRKEMGLRTSRVFSTKNGKECSEWKRFK